MAIIRFRDADGKIQELACLKGEKGDPGSGGGGGASNAKDIAYDGEREYISATDVESALKVTSAAILDLYGQIDGAAEVISEIKTTLGVE